MKTGSIHQSVDFNTTPKMVYDLIMNSELHSAFTGGPVVMSKTINGSFSVFDGYCTGHTIELKEGERIVQAWNFKEEGWPEDHYSVCTFVFSKTPTGCRLDFTQTEIPEHKVEALMQGWEEYYWEPMKNYLATV